jgi:hypothetical protein
LPNQALVLIAMAADTGIENKKEALHSYVDLGKQQITLASAIIAFTATFIKDLTATAGSDAPDLILYVGWGSLFISIVAGLWLHGRGVSIWSESNFDVDEDWLAWLGRAQQLTFLLGIALILVFVAIEL